MQKSKRSESMITKKNRKSSLFKVTIGCEVSCRFNLWVKAKIRLTNNFLGDVFPSLSKKWQDDQMWADENAYQAHNTLCDTRRKAPPPGEKPRF